MFDVYGGIDYGKLRRIIREITPSGILTGFRPKDRDSDIGSIYSITDEEVVFTNLFTYAGDYVARYNVYEDKFIWKRGFGSLRPWGVDYDDSQDIVAVGLAGGGTVLLRGKDGGTVRTITSIGSYKLQETSAAVFNPANPDELYIVDRAVHVVFKYNWRTGSYKMFGEWGVSGSDYSHLKTPLDVEVDPDNDDVFVADTWNGRVLRLDLDLTSVKDLLLLPRPGFIRKARWGTSIYSRHGMMVISAESGGGGNYVIYTFGYLRGRKLVFVLPHQTDYPRFSRDLGKIWFAAVYGYYFSIDTVYGTFRYQPQVAPVLRRWTVDISGWATEAFPIHVLGRKAQVLVYSNQSGTLYIEVPDTLTIDTQMGRMGFSVPTDFNWVEWDSIAVSAGKMETYNFSIPPPCFRVRFVPSATATVTLIVSFFP